MFHEPLVLPLWSTRLAGALLSTELFHPNGGLVTPSNVMVAVFGMVAPVVRVGSGRAVNWTLPCPSGGNRLASRNPESTGASAPVCGLIEPKSQVRRPKFRSAVTRTATLIVGRSGTTTGP